MASSANYSATPLLGSGSCTTGDTSRTAPALANAGVITVARNNGARVDRLPMAAIGTTVASMARLFTVEGFAGEAIQSITFSGTTATVTTTLSHGLTTGDLVTVQGVKPRQYNVESVAVTVLTPTTFTYTMAQAPQSNATTVGEYSYTPAAPTFSLLLEFPITANTPSASNPVISRTFSESTNPELFPLILPPGHQLRCTVNDTQTSSGLNYNAIGGHF